MVKPAAFFSALEDAVVFRRGIVQRHIEIHFTIHRPTPPCKLSSGYVQQSVKLETEALFE